MKITVDIGGGNKPRNPFKADKVICVDPGIKKPNTVNCWVGMQPIPIESNSVHYVTAYHVLEHIPRVLWKDDKLIYPFIEAMNEIYRILKPGGKFYAETPHYPHAPVFQDPTHVNIITCQTINYFIESHNFNKHCKVYGFKGKFKKIKQEKEAFVLKWTLTKI